MLQTLINNQTEQLKKIEADYFKLLADFGKLNNKAAIELELNEKLKDYSVLLMIETSEAIRELSYKPHKPFKTPDFEKFDEELIDQLKYLLNIFILRGYDAMSIKKLFDYKTKLVYERYENDNRV